jgi:hypothetical protein
MKIPKYVEKLIDRRTKLAEDLMCVSSELDEWLDKNNINAGTDYTATGCMIYCEPSTAGALVKRDILEKE